MSNQTTEDDTLFSQDDIDKLLNSGSFGGAEEKLADSGSSDDPGELSQDDIDKLLNSNLSDPKEDLDSVKIPDDDLELVSQEDIDQLMNSGLTAEKEEDGEEFEELSEEDIKALISSQDIKTDKKESFDPPDQRAIDPELKSPEKENSENEAILSPSPPDEERQKTDPYTIDATEAVDVSKCLIAQNTLDDLIKQAVPKTDEFSIPPDMPSEDMSVSLDADMDELISSGKDADQKDVTQEDIDALLSEPEEEDEEEDDILISQDDIDTLLMAADQEDEDLLGDLMKEGPPDDSDESRDEDILDEGSLEDERKSHGDEDLDEASDDSEDRVILEGDDEVPVKAVKKKKKAGSPGFRKKLVLVFASVLVVFGITVPAAYFLFFSSSNKVAEHATEPAVAVQEVKKEIPVEIPVEEAKPVAKVEPKAEPKTEPKTEPVNQSGNILLNGFVILTPEPTQNIVYITADVSIDYTDMNAFHEIHNNLAMYRDLIYGAVNQGIFVNKAEKITEADLLSMIESALKKKLPGNAIGRVSFSSFKTS